MVDIVTRTAKGSPLTHAELDGNFTNLKAAVETAVADHYAAAVLADVPHAYWRLNEAYGATTLADSSGNGRDATSASTSQQYPALGAGRIARYMGSSGMFSMPASAAGFADTGQFTIEVLARFDASGATYSQIFGIGIAQSSVTSGIMFIWRSNSPCARLWSASAAMVEPVVPFSLPLYEWHHLALVYDGANLMIYVNGSVAVSVAAASYMTAAVRSVGGMGKDNWGDPSATGHFSDLALYSSALSASRIALHARLAAGASA
jgi:hypothetical protein